jgi:hypothetical protein
VVHKLATLHPYLATFALVFHSTSDPTTSSLVPSSLDVADPAFARTCDESPGQKVAKHDKSGVDLDRVTAHFEEQNMNSAALTDSAQAMLESSGPAKKSAGAT